MDTIDLHARPASRDRARTRRLLLSGSIATGIATGVRAASTGPTPASRISLPNAYDFAVVPQFSAAEIDRDWSPILARLGARLGVSLRLVVAPSIPAFEQALWRGEPDFAFANPYHQLVAQRLAGYLPLVRDARPLVGILVVRADDGLPRVHELDGREVAFPAPNAFAASLLMRATLVGRDGVRVHPRYVATHPNVYREVLLGRVPAGGGTYASLARQRPEVQRHLQVLMATPAVASHPVCAHPRVPPALRSAFADALLHMAEDDADALLLAAARIERPVVADHARDYAPLAAYRLEAYAAEVR